VGPENLFIVKRIRWRRPSLEVAVLFFSLAVEVGLMLSPLLQLSQLRLLYAISFSWDII